MYILVKKDSQIVYPYTIDMLKKDNKDTSFPSPIPNERLAEWGVYPVIQTDPPSFNPSTQVLEQPTAVYNEDLLRWETSWGIRDLTTEEIRAKIPTVVTIRQGKKALFMTPYQDTNLLDLINTVIASIQDSNERRLAEIDWEFATEIKRDFPLVTQLKATLGLTEEQLDNLFLLASTL